MNYLPFDQRTADTQYRDRLRLILNEGEMVKETQQGVGALTYMAPPPMRFRLENGVPLITERKAPFWRGAVGELLAFINGARRTEELEAFGCKWWSSWLTEEKCRKRGLEPGDNGPGSYGAAFHDFPTAEGPAFNQFEEIVKQIKEEPQLRSHIITPWIPQYTIRVKSRQQKVVVTPCHGWIQLRIIKSKLTLHMIQMKADMPVGVPSNMIQYAALTLALAHVTGYAPYEFIHSFSDAHIYEDQIADVEEMLKREPRRLPTMTMNKVPNNIFDVRPEDFDITDYDPHPPIKGIPVAV
nr:Thymidylate synthase [uncultured bacterium]